KYDSLVSHGLFSEAERHAWCALLARLLPPPPARVLDVGTGTGFLAFRVAELGHDVVGVDLSQEMLGVARAAPTAATAATDDPSHGTLRFVDGDADLGTVEALGPFDAVVCRHLLWTLPNPEATLRRWRDVLVPGGVAVAVDGTWFAAARMDRTLAR